MATNDKLHIISSQDKWLCEDCGKVWPKHNVTKCPDCGAPRKLSWGCANCELYKSHKTVGPAGKIGQVPDFLVERTELMLVGEGPGEQEVEQGIPFVGKAGDTLRTALKACGIDEDLVSIGNAAKCRPMKGNSNRAPTDMEIRNCLPYLEDSIAKHPNLRVIVALGNVACQSLLGRGNISLLRGKASEKPIRGGE